jgi:hypothetical protein
MAACMTSILALSVTDKIEQYGAYAGFAAVLGLAVLSLLYFAQAREVKRLREWAGRAPERAADLQDRVQSAAQQRVVAQPVPPRPAGPVPAAGPGAAQRPAAATPAGQAQGVPAAAPAAAATATPGAPGVPGAGQPTTVQPAANGAVGQPKPGQPLRVPPSAAVPPPPRTGGAAAPEPEEHGRSIWAIVGAAAALVVVGLVLVFAVFGVGGGGGNDKVANTIGTPGQGSSTTSNASKTTSSGTPAATPKPGTYTVAVLNGTAVPGLARGVANRLQNTKFKIGNVTNAADQSRSATLVEYAPGHLAEAQAVAKAIDVGKDAIQAVDAGSRAIAGDRASVVVVVGSDQNTSPQTTP